MRHKVIYSYIHFMLYYMYSNDVVEALKSNFFIRLQITSTPE